MTEATGRTYASDMNVRDQDGRRVSRVDNPRWQSALRDYLLSGDAVIMMRPEAVGINPTTWDAVHGGGILGTDGTHVIYRVRGQRA